MTWVELSMPNLRIRLSFKLTCVHSERQCEGESENDKVQITYLLLDKGKFHYSPDFSNNFCLDYFFALKKTASIA